MLLPLQGVLASPTHKPRVPLRSALGYALLGFQPVFDKEFSSVTLCLTKSFLCDSVFDKEFSSVFNKESS